MKDYLPDSRNSLWYSQKISELRAHIGLSQAAFAQKLGVSGAAIGQLERGESKSPSADLLAALASKLSVNLDWLLNGEGEMLKSTSVSTIKHPTTLQYTESFHRDRLLKGTTPFAEYKKLIPSAAAMQEFADHFDTTVEELAASLPPRKQKAPGQRQVPEFIAQLKLVGALTVSLEQQGDYIKRVLEQKAQVAPKFTAKATKDCACFEVAEGIWVASKLVASRTEYMPDMLYTVVTSTGIFTRHVSAGKSPGDIMAYTHSPGVPPNYFVAKNILEVWAFEMKLTTRL